jgi:hypothetical protein
VFCGALAALGVIAVLYVMGQVNPGRSIGYLWFNPIGCAVCVIVSYVLQVLFDARNGGRSPPTGPRIAPTA